MPKSSYSIRLTSRLLSACKRRPDIVTSHMNVFVTKNCLGHARLGVKILKNAIHLAVVRNMVKRRFFVEFRQIADMYSKDIIVIISKKIYSEKKEISDILMQEWKQSLKSSNKFF